MRDPKIGVLAGWKKVHANSGMVLTVQLGKSRESFADHAYEEVSIVMNDRQLRSLTRDLTRSVASRNLDVFAPRRWWRR